MIYRISKENTEKLKELPETGMGYQIVTTPYASETYIIWNAKFAFDYPGFDSTEDTLTNRNFVKNKTMDEIMALAQPKSLSYFSLISTKEPSLVRESRGKTEGAIYNKSENANGDELFVRLSAFEEDFRIDKKNNSLLPGSFTTTASEAIKCKVEKDDPIQRYALPNELPIEWGFYIQPKTSDILQRGNVEANFGKKGGGREVYFEKGTSKRTFITQMKW